MDLDFQRMETAWFFIHKKYISIWEDSVHRSISPMLFFFTCICLISAVGSLQPGLVNLAVIQTVLQRGTFPATCLAVGGCLPEMLYAWLAIQAHDGMGGWASQMIQHPAARWIALGGLAGAGVYYVCRPAVAWGVEPRPARPWAAFGKGLILALYNAQLVVFWILVWAFVQVHWPPPNAMTRSMFQIAFVLGSGLGALFFLLSLVVLVDRYNEKIKTAFGRRANQWTGIVLLLMAAWGMVQAVI